MRLLPWWASIEVNNREYIQGIGRPVRIVNLSKLITEDVDRQDNKNPNDPSKQEHFQTAPRER